ncbi:MAG: hypothetical protein R3349_03445 [Geminicoccaceae bacterium]|nr:hypothetical protein [Geminicoccaceae bacterium]
MQNLRDRSFRPRRQVLGPLPYLTTGGRGPAVRQPHLTVPPYTFDPPEIRTDLTGERTRHGPGERFSRFRAQVERSSEQQLDEDGTSFSGALPATLPVQPPASIWRRLFRLFGAG